MKSVSAQVISSKPVSLAKASKILSNFVSIDNGASHAVSVYLRRAATSFADLNQFHKDLKSSSSSSSKSTKKHSQIISFDFEQDDTESKEIKNKVKDSEGSLGIEVDKSEVKKKNKRKGQEIDCDVSLNSSEHSGLSKKKKRKMEANR